MDTGAVRGKKSSISKVNDKLEVGPNEDKPAFVLLGVGEDTVIQVKLLLFTPFTLFTCKTSPAQWRRGDASHENGDFTALEEQVPGEERGSKRFYSTMGT